MPRRRNPRRLPSQSPSSGLQRGDESSLRKRNKTVLNTNRDEGVLYTVKVTDRSNKTSKGPSPPPQSDEPQPQQYTISKLRKDNGSWLTGLYRSFGIDSVEWENVDSHLYKPSKTLSSYINWTFYASFTSVFLSFLAIFIVLCLLFAGFYALAGHVTPECIVVSGNPYGTNPESRFSDAFAMSWTTFTTVGYGNTYTATGNDFVKSESADCSGVVFLCTLESFMGLLYAGMCAAILFGKVNRVQSHAHVTFANAVCLQYEHVDSDQYVDDDSIDSDVKDIEDFASEEDDKKVDNDRSARFSIESEKIRQQSFREQFKGCPVLKFQVVNDFCNKIGGEIVDGMMKVIGIKMKTHDGKITHSQYVRVNLVDFEHPFFGRVWHGVHILDGTSPLLTDMAKKRIKENQNSWPEKWLENPEKVRRKLDFHSLIITVAGVSNVSACTVHAYKRYKLHDIIIGFDFAPLVYENEIRGKLQVDLGLANDVREQRKGSGEDLNSIQFPREENSSSGKIGERSRTSDRGSTRFQESDIKY